MRCQFLATCALLAACGASSARPPVAPQPAGDLSGTVTFAGDACASPGPGCTGPMADYDVIVLAADHHEVARTRSAADGTYHLALAPGSYVIETPAGIDKTAVKQNPVTVVSAQPAKLDLVVDTGVR